MTSTVTHVVAGFSDVLLSRLDGLLPAGSVLVLEDPQVVSARDAVRRAAAHPCVAGLTEAPVQREDDPGAVPAAVARPDGLQAVLPAVEYAVVAAAGLAESWRVPGAGVPAARILRDKARLRHAAGAAGLPQPAWRVVESLDEAAAFRATLGGACVLKPANRQASLGVQLLEPEDDLAAAWRRLIGADEPRLRGELSTGHYLMEQRLRGREVSVEMLVDRGRPGFVNVCAKTVQPGPHPVELGHQVPADIAEPDRDRLAALTAGLATATGFRSGVLHAEWIVTPGAGPHLVECAGRLPGDRIVDLIDLAYDLDLTAAWTAILQGRPGQPHTTARRGAAIRFLTAAPGTVTAVDGTGPARSAPGVHDVQITARIGDVLAPVSSSWDRIGSVLATGDDAAQADRRARHAADLITVRAATR
ncbi:ATP-grasp domain-containing protein [Actinoplanes flavus]|uniref:ATP-grasp domain-containing protein n=1 Tax=Actinoplanes flavus TaxID=2820290 RepID=A0ABS3UN95_9ACTN|nr:ATP-grasp domain-containing protein [Actinoplanes flavus]MBO3740239.1 ATP-grasp domain-containing protein [Actinoplanes flavus]